MYHQRDLLAITEDLNLRPAQIGVDTVEPMSSDSQTGPSLAALYPTQVSGKEENTSSGQAEVSAPATGASVGTLGLLGVLIGLALLASSLALARKEAALNPPAPPPPPPPSPPPLIVDGWVRVMTRKPEWYKIQPLMRSQVDVDEFEDQYGHRPAVGRPGIMVKLSELNAPSDLYWGQTWTTREGWQIKIRSMNADDEGELVALGAINIDSVPDPENPGKRHWSGLVGVLENSLPLDNPSLYDVTWVPEEQWNQQGNPPVGDPSEPIDSAISDSDAPNPVDDLVHQISEVFEQNLSDPELSWGTDAALTNALENLLAGTEMDGTAQPTGPDAEDLDWDALDPFSTGPDPVVPNEPGDGIDTSDGGSEPDTPTPDSAADPKGAPPSPPTPSEEALQRDPPEAIAATLVAAYGIAGALSYAVAAAEAAVAAGATALASASQRVANLLGSGRAAAQGEAAATAEAAAAQANRLHHIFDKSEHALDSLVTQFGSQAKAFDAVQQAANQALKDGKLMPNAQGILPKVGAIIEVGGTQVQLIGGRVVDGVVRISSFSRWGL